MLATPPRPRAMAGIAAMCALGLLSCGPAVRQRPIVAPEGSRTYSADYIAHLSARTAWDVLEQLGVVRLSEAADGSEASMRAHRGRTSIELRDSDVPLLVIDGVRVSDVRALRDITARSILSIRVFNGIEATVREGTNAGAGAIEIITRSGPETDSASR